MLVNNRLIGLSDAAGLASHSVMLSAFSVGNTSSRVFFGYFSDVLAKRIPRHWFLVLDSWLMLLACGVLMLCVGQAEAPKDATTLGVFIGGFAFGAPWMMVPAIEMHWYGQAKFGTIHGVMMFATAVGLILVRIGGALFPSLHGDLSFCLAFAATVALFGTAGFAIREGLGKRKAPEQAAA